MRYMELLIAILGVKATTCSEISYLELGRLSIKTEIKIQQYLFWKKVRELDDDEPRAKDRNYTILRSTNREIHKH